jgi:6-phosphogluconolactonase
MITPKKNMVSVFRTIEAMNESAARWLVDLAGRSVAARGRFVLCLSGGDTPKGLYTLLSMEPRRDLVPWKRTFVFWGDERCVPADDERNNAHTANVLLLRKTDLPSSHNFSIPVNLRPADAARRYEETLRGFFGQAAPRFDLVLLGLGENGHTASLFPGTAALRERSHWVKDVFVEDQGMSRITLTATLINKARHILFLVTGERKAQILKTVLGAPRRPDRYPAQSIRPARGEIRWYVDDKAASLLPDGLYCLSNG